MTRLVDLTMFRGDTQIYNVSVIDNMNNIINISGALFWFTVKDAMTDVSPVFQKAIGSGIVITNAPMGMITITIDPSDTSSLPTENVPMIYDLQMKNASLQIFTLNAGNFLVTPDANTGTS